MAYEVTWTDPALDDLREATEYIGRTSSDRADEFVSRVFEAVDSLSHNPERGALIPGYTVGGLQSRHLLFGNYRILYTVTGRNVEIQGFTHTSRQSRGF